MVLPIAISRVIINESLLPFIFYCCKFAAEN